MDFKDFCEQETMEKVKSNASKNNSKLNDEDVTKKAEQTYQKYANYSTDELMSELLNQTKQKKQNGSLDKQKMEQIYNTLYNIIPEQNRKNLDEIFNKLK